MGCGAVLFPSVPPRDKSPAHPDYWPVWAALEDAGVPFMLHVGGGGRPLRRAFHENGKPPVTDFLGGGENIRSKDYMALHHPPEIFLACLALDGIFEQFPGLRGGCIEQGALWVVTLLQRLDLAQATFQKTEPALRLPLKPSEYLRRQVKFTPFPTEPVGWLIEQAGPELFCFSSDYPHPEGGRDPLGRFEASLAGVDEDAKERFYTTNYAEMMGPVLASRVLKRGCRRGVVRRQHLGRGALAARDRTVHVAAPRRSRSRRRPSGSVRPARAARDRTASMCRARGARRIRRASTPPPTSPVRRTRWASPRVARSTTAATRAPRADGRPGTDARSAALPRLRGSTRAHRAGRGTPGRPACCRA